MKNTAPTELSIVKFLKQFDNVNTALIELKNKYAININQHSIYENLVQLKYDQIKSPFNVDLVKECRGIILDKNTLNVVAYPFSKFFSYGEHHASTIDWNNAKYWEKIDGSLMFLYYYNNKFNVASSGLPDARGLVSDKSMTFNELFWSIWNKNNYDLPIEQNITYIFEMTSPLTQVLIPRTTNDIHLIGARNLNTMKEIDIDTISCNWKKVKSFPLKSKEDAIKICETIDPMIQEGFVITDINFNRIKLKSPQYVAISHLGLTPNEIISKGLNLEKYDENLQEKWMIKIILVNECTEFLTYYPQYTQLYNKIKSKYDKLLNETIELYNSVKHITNSFDYAAKVKAHPLCGVLFSIKSGNITSIEEGIRKTDINKLNKIIKSY